MGFNIQYNSIHKKYFKSSIRSFNYRFIFVPLPTSDKFNTDNRCVFCIKYRDSLKHISIECNIIKDLLYNQKLIHNLNIITI
jgi:hypothetical protein